METQLKKEVKKFSRKFLNKEFSNSPEQNFNLLTNRIMQFVIREQRRCAAELCQFCRHGIESVYFDEPTLFEGLTLNGWQHLVNGDHFYPCEAAVILTE